MRKKNIKSIVHSMKDNLKYNKKQFENTFGDLNYYNKSNQSLLHLVVSEHFSETHCYLAIQSLLMEGVNPNLKDVNGYNFIQTALISGFSERFIIDVLTLSLSYNLNINHTDNNKNTILHTAILSENYKGGFITLYDNMIRSNYNSTIKNNDDMTIMDAMNLVKNSKKIFQSEMDVFSKIYEREILNYLNNFAVVKDENKVTNISNGLYYSNSPLILKKRYIKYKMRNELNKFIIDNLDMYCLNKNVYFKNNVVKNKAVKLISNFITNNDYSLESPSSIIILIIESAFAAFTMYKTNYIETEHFIDAIDYIKDVLDFRANNMYQDVEASSNTSLVRGKVIPFKK